MAEQLGEADVRGLANAYRAALDEGGRQLGAGSLEGGILTAIAAESMSGANHWITTRVPDGDRVAQPLDDLTKKIVAEDTVGRVVGSLEDHLYKALRGTVTSLVLQGSVPEWVIVAGSVITGILGFSYKAGAGAGALVFAAATTGGTALAVVIRAARVAPSAIESVGSQARLTYSRAGAIGAAALGVFDSSAAPAVRSVYGRLAVTPPPLTIVRRIRSYAQGVLVVVYLLAAVAIVFAIAGGLHGFDQAAKEKFPSTTIPPTHLTIPGFPPRT